MLKMIITGAIISNGYDGRPPLRFSEGENGCCVRFRIGQPVFDKRCKDNRRWINLNVKAFGGICERIKKMKLKEGIYVNIIGRYDEEIAEGEQNQAPRRFPVVIVDDIEFCHNSGGQKNEQSGAQAGGSKAGQPSAPQECTNAGESHTQPTEQAAGQMQGQQTQPAAPPMPNNFTGYANLSGAENPYF